MHFFLEMFAEMIIKPAQTQSMTFSKSYSSNKELSFCPCVMYHATTALYLISQISYLYNSCLYGNLLRTLCSLWMIWKLTSFHIQRHSRHNRAPWLFDMRDREKWLLAPTLNKISISAHRHLWCDGKQHTMCDGCLNRFSYCYIRVLMTEIVFLSLTQIGWAEFDFFD